MVPRSLLLTASAALMLGTFGGLPLLPSVAIAQTTVDEQTSIKVYRTASPAVVTIRAGRGSGSGSIVSAEGLVLTNDHVVRNAPSGQVVVNTAGGKRYTGQVIARNRSNDLALVQLSTRDRLPTIRLGNSNEIAVGQRVFAIGSPFGLSGTFTTGILSRIAPNGVLQTDAAINPGNSGGPLLNSKAELIGVNTAILSPGGGNIGIGFATSVTVARNFIQTARANPGVGLTAAQPEADRVRLGVDLDSTNFVIQEVQAGSLAAAIGLRPGDRILAVNGRRLTMLEQLTNALNPASDVILTIARNRRVANVRIRL